MAGGITTRLWDDPFEWTLPEKLYNEALIEDYLDEVEESRLRAFSYLRTDEDLDRQTPAPTQLITIEAILRNTLAIADAFAESAAGGDAVRSND